jgi:hypothetical protein
MKLKSMMTSVCLAAMAAAMLAMTAPTAALAQDMTKEESCKAIGADLKLSGAASDTFMAGCLKNAVQRFIWCTPEGHCPGPGNSPTSNK